MIKTIFVHYYCNAFFEFQVKPGPFGWRLVPKICYKERHQRMAASLIAPQPYHFRHSYTGKNMFCKKYDQQHFILNFAIAFFCADAACSFEKGSFSTFACLK